MERPTRLRTTGDMVCQSCSKRDVFIIKPRDSDLEMCECMISEDQNCLILNEMIGKWCRDPPKERNTLKTILTLLSSGTYADDFILGRDRNIQFGVTQAYKYLFGGEKLGKWDYIDVGCGTFIPTLNIATDLGTYPLGIDYIDRRKCDPDQLYYGIIKDGIVPSYGDCQFRFATLCDILHHTLDPEGLVLQILEMVVTNGFILIMDLECTSWKDAYYFDLSHLAYAKCVGEKSGDYLPVHGYRSRKFWRDFMKTNGCEIVYSNMVLDSYKAYIDVYKKSR